MKDNKEKEDSIFLTVIKRLLKRVRPSTILILVLLLSCNVFAWFIYTTRVDSNITAHVKAWNIAFIAGNTQLSQEVNFNVANIYPGMTTYEETITATNNGETQASFTYEIISATILGTTYTVDGTILTSNELLRKLEEDYPFSVIFNVSSDTLLSQGGVGSFTLQVIWAYESGDDVADTYWGNEAYLYHQTNPGIPSISLTMQIHAVQVTE